MKVMRLAMKHIKGVRQLDILAHPTCNEIAGANGAGKSSVLDAIVWAFSGKRAIDSKPLRHGAEKGEIVVETETLEVRRRFSENGDTKLTITAKDGSKLGQRELDGLFGRFSFDPLAFSRMPPAEQLTTLQGLAGEEFCGKLAALDKQIAAAMEERTLAGRELARIGAIPEVPQAEPVDVSALTAELQAAEKHNHEQAKRTQDLELLRQREVQTEAEVLRLKEQLDAAAARLDAIRNQTKIAPQPAVLVDKEAMHVRLAEAGAANQRAAAFVAYKARVAEKTAKAQAVNAVEAYLGELRDEREALRRSAQLPVPGVEFGEAGLRVGGIPFEQLASSERIRISARIGMSMSPELRVMFIRDGSLLDDQSFRELRTLAEERDYQVWCETVGAGHGDAIVLEAGEVASAPLASVGAF